ncbi:DNA adenine methylase [Thermosynechococcaceae cyanobacterium BACA0444]|uniref:site-specific DNA-methyltransferase (adenine-specific) n=1 Tax=Pseudocalidococcus azoricus BACA0444 TaxID=2918990 RepID=A0AAE4JWN7_9CYAN|nr:DNA adenine methylase [Pseudocalidococcus azoricus]MDS3861585.1 DNA adenine methylase [Pseudocalidococcus azoricus BACA0444]
MPRPLHLRASKVLQPQARPFLKWAGGKSQLMGQIIPYLPQALINGEIETYIEPFIGGGALFLEIAQHYPVKNLIIADVNPEIVLAYRVIQTQVSELISALAFLESQYLQAPESERETMFYAIRQAFNQSQTEINYACVADPEIQHTAQLIFLNRTCFNGLFRVNQKGEFNVPFGRYVRPRICQADNLQRVAQLLSSVKILRGDFELIRPFVNPQTFVYFDPPYRPISKTASFKAYAQANFTDHEQTRLATFARELDQRGAKLLLSNSDPHNEDPADHFFETLYDSFQIYRLQAKRAINSNSSKRGPVSELLILNYLVETLPEQIG